MTRRAFTMIELLVVVTVVIVLVAIGLVSVRAVMDKRNDVVDISNLGATMKDFHAWSADHNGQMLNVGLPGDPGARWYYGGSIAPDTHSWLSVIAHYKGQVGNWPRILARWTGASHAHWHASAGIDTLDGQIDPDRVDHAYLAGYPSRFVYSFTFLTSSECWQDPSIAIDNDTFGREHLTRVYAEQVSHPASKGVLKYSTYPGPSNGHPVAFADGSAEVALKQSALPTAMDPVYPDIRWGTVHGTLHGHKGRDYRR